MNPAFDMNQAIDPVLVITRALHMDQAFNPFTMNQDQVVIRQAINMALWPYGLWSKMRSWTGVDWIPIRLQ